MSNGKKPSHIALPAKPSPQDVFSASSALDSAPTPSSANGSPSGSPHRNVFDSINSRRSNNRSHLSPSVGGSTRKPTFVEQVHPRLRGASGTHDRSARQSFSSQNRRASRVTSIHNGKRRGLMSPGADGDEAGSQFGNEGKPAIPALVPGIRPAYSTPLPLLAMIVLSIAMMSEFLSANVSTPFILRMVRGFFLSEGKSHGAHPDNSETEALVGFWTGNLVSVFFITQFFTSLLWSSIADKYGRRLVLVISLLGSALSVMTFGTSRSLPEAICVRLAQGVFGGSIGVFRGSIRDITDPTNEASAYAILGFAWGMGGVVGPIIGGVFESPSANHPDWALGKISLFATYPYLLPALIAGAILTIGALLATRLSWDGGPRRPRIALPLDKEENGIAPALDASPRPESTVGTIRRKASSVFAPQNDVLDLTPAQMRVATIKDEEAQERNRRASRASFGTAYGYGGIRVKREEMAARAMAAQSGNATDDTGAGEDHEHLGLARKFLLANEENTFNLNELWVSAATAAEDSAVFEDEEDEDETQDDDGSQAGSHLATPSRQFTGNSPYRDRSPLLDIPEPDHIVPKPRLGGLTEAGLNHRISSNMNRVSVSSRRFSAVSRHLPAIYTNTGLQTPPAIAAAYESDYLDSQGEATGHAGGLSAIHEGRAADSPSRSETGTIRLRTETDEPEVKPSAGESNFRALPKLIILQYGLLAFHDTGKSTLHGQIFMTFLVSEYRAGGLGLFPSSFSLLIAIMCLCQLYYQFYLYPHIGPPRGKLSHLHMFRLGSMLYIPAYLTLPMLRRFANPETPGSPVVMMLLIVNMFVIPMQLDVLILTSPCAVQRACRYAGGTFSYTSIMVLVNAMSPPHVVGLANGFAQSLVSFGRFVGPVIGGLVWSSAMKGNPDGYYQPFYVVAITCAVQVSLSYLIR